MWTSRLYLGEGYADSGVEGGPKDRKALRADGRRGLI